MSISQLSVVSSRNLIEGDLIFFSWMLWKCCFLLQVSTVWLIWALRDRSWGPEKNTVRRACIYFKHRIVTDKINVSNPQLRPPDSITCEGICTILQAKCEQSSYQTSVIYFLFFLNRITLSRSLPNPANTCHPPPHRLFILSVHT